MSHNTSCQPKRQGKSEQAKKREGVYPDVFTMRWGEFLWKVGLLVAATMIAASEEA